MPRTSRNQNMPRAAANRLSPLRRVPLALLGLLAAGCGREQSVLAPTLTAISPGPGAQAGRAAQPRWGPRPSTGATVAVALAGANFANGATVNVGGARLGASRTVVVSSRQITAAFAIAASAAPGAAEISVTSAGRTTGAVPFTSLAPLAVIATTPAYGATGLAPDARITLEGHTDDRASAAYNQALAQRRVAISKRYLVAQGVPAANIETHSFGKRDELDAAQVHTAIESDPSLDSAQRRTLLANLPSIALAQNRRADSLLNATGQKSLRRYPFNAKDALTLLRESALRK